MQIKHPEYFGQLLHKEGFKTWFLYMFRVIEGRKFTVEDLHDGLFEEFQDIYDGKRTRENINVPPRSGKTTMAMYFLAYVLAVNAKCNFIYTSFSQELLSGISSQLSGILQHPIYKAMYNNYSHEESFETSPLDEFWEKYLLESENKEKFTSRKIVTKEGGVILFASIGSTITGFGCKSYDTLIDTERGLVQIGEIVEKKMNLSIKSYNIKSKKIEYKSIEKFIYNERQSYRKITLDNGEIIKSTTDHIFYDKNFNHILCNDLQVGMRLPSDSFNDSNRYIKFFRYILSRIVFITNKINLFFSKFCSAKITSSTSLVSNTISDFRPNNAALNITNTRISNTIFFSYFFIGSFIFSYLYCSFFIKLLENSILTKLIICVVLSCSVCKIFKPVVSRIRIKMSTLFIRLANKSKKNKPVYRKFLLFPTGIKAYSNITFFNGITFKNLVSFFRKNFSTLRYKIPVNLGYRKIVDIVDIQEAPSYCLAIKDNNNFFITKSQVLVHNCGIRGAKEFSGALFIDDANKPADIRSQVKRTKVRTYYEETLLTRLNESHTPIVNIQQRLHMEDLSGILTKIYKFNTLKRPLLIDEVCQLPSQYTPERIQELQQNKYMFGAQYQQEPTMEGGNLFKLETIREVKAESLPAEYDFRFIVGDLSYKAKESNDYQCFTYWGVKNETLNDIQRPHLYLIDCKRKKLNSVDVEPWITPWIEQKITYGFRYIWIEDKSHGIYLNQSYRKKGLPVPSEQMLKETLPRDVDKVMRANNVIPCLDSLNPNMTFNTDIENYTELLQELLAFDSGDHDDFVDNVIDGIKIGLFKKKVTSLDIL